MGLKRSFVSAVSFLALVLAACGGGGGGGGGNGGGGGGTVELPPENPAEIWFSTLAGTPDWTPETHGKLSTSALSANVPVVFDGGRVREITIVIQDHNWKLMQSNLADLKEQMGTYDPFNTLPDPVYVPAEIFCDGKEWYKVGVRYKGSSTLYLPKNGKLPFKLKFNEFSDHYPELANQRFYGFKTLHLKNNFNDDSMLHEVLAGNLFREFGVPVSHASWWKINVDNGDGSGPKYFGLYTMVEDVEDTVLKLQLGSSSGNVYKPEGDAASFAEGTWDTVQFGLQNNEEGATYADVGALYAALNDQALFDSDRQAWKTDLEAGFDVDLFMRWLAANTVMQNWDTYGVVGKNYYLYNDPADSLLKWVPWDNNEAMFSNPNCVPVNLLGAGRSWPLLWAVRSDAEYFDRYRQAVYEFGAELYDPARMNPIIDQAALAIRGAVLSETADYTHTTPARFEAAVETLKGQVADRHGAALAFDE